MVLAASLLAGQESQVPTDRGFIQAGAYHSVFFNFDYRLPVGWEGTTLDPTDFRGAASKVAKDEANASKIKQGIDAAIPLLTVTERGSTQSIHVSAVDVYFEPDMTVEQFLDATEDAVSKMTNFKVERLGTHSKEVSGRKVVTRWLKTSMGPAVVYQAMTAFIERRYLVHFVSTFTAEASLAKHDVASALTFAGPVPQAADANAAKEAKPREPQPEDAEITGGKYSNSFFNLTVTVPENWQIQEAEAIHRLKAAGERMSNGRAETDDANTESAEANATQPRFLLTAMTKVKGAVVMSFCQDLLLAPEIESPEQYLKMMIQGIPGGEVVAPPRTVTVNGKSYARGEYLQRVGEIPVKHLIYVTMEKKFAIVFDVISSNPGQAAEGQKIIETAVFTPKQP